MTPEQDTTEETGAPMRQSAPMIETTETAIASVEQYGEGTILRGANGRFLPGSRSPVPITDANARQYQQRRLQLKRERVMAGANAAVAATGRFDGRGLDFVDAIAEVRTAHALTLEPGSNEAATWIMKHSGLDEPKQAEQGSGRTVADVTGFVAELRGFLADVMTAQRAGSGQAVDGRVEDAGHGTDV